jgi:hypothetical protein
VVTGPIATITFQQELADFAVGAWVSSRIRGPRLPPAPHAPAAVDLKGAGGNLIPNRNPFDPLNGGPARS